jgi:hypothetical protein
VVAWEVAVKVIEAIVSWAQPLGLGGAFFVISLCAFGVCGMALWVVLTALKRNKQ